MVLSVLFFIFFWVRVLKEDHKDIKEYNCENGKLCNFCLNFVSFDSKHCKLCNKCVVRYDHHCKVLNTCIGKANYSSFMKTLLFCFLINLMISTFSGIFIQYYSNDKENLYFSSTRLSSIINTKVVFILSLICLAFSLIWSVSIILLFGFHLHLMRKNLTTYEYILIKRKKKLNGIETGENGNIKLGAEITKIIPR